VAGGHKEIDLKWTTGDDPRQHLDMVSFDFDIVLLEYNLKIHLSI